MAAKKRDNRFTGKEPVFIVKPVAKGHGLDYLHLTLAVLVVILVVFAFALSLSKPANVTTCPSGTGTCTAPKHNSTAVLSAADHALVYYSSINTSLSLLPYYSLVNRSTASYVPAGGYWLVVVPYISPFNRSIVYNFTMIMNDSDLSVRNAFINTIRPLSSASRSVTALGAVGIDDTAVCNRTRPIPVYLITDPYAPGALPAINRLINASAIYGNSIASNYFVVFSSYAISRYSGFGIAQTQLLGNYMYCASKQSPRDFRQFIANLTIAYTGQPLSNSTLGDVARGSSLNATRLASCLANSSSAINYQAELASHYNITATPQFIVNCKYLTIPQTLDYAINYSLAGTGRTG